MDSYIALKILVKKEDQQVFNAFDVTDNFLCSCCKFPAKCRRSEYLIDYSQSFNLANATAFTNVGAYNILFHRLYLYLLT